MKTYTVKTTTFNLPLVYLSVMGMTMLALVPCGFEYLRSYLGYSQKFEIWPIGVFVVAVIFLPIGLEYFRNQKYLNVEITDEGIRANWFVSGRSRISRNLLWTSFYKRVQRQIKWDEIENIELGDIKDSKFHGVWIRVNNEKRYYWFGCQYFLKKPGSYKELIPEIEAHKDKMRRIVEEPVKQERESDLPDFPDI